MTRTAETPLAEQAPGRPLNLGTMLGQVDRWTWMRMGVHANSTGWSVASDYAHHRLPGRRGQRLMIKLDADDRYSVEIGRLWKLDYRVLGQLHGISSDQLAETIEALYQAV